MTNADDMVKGTKGDRLLAGVSSDRDLAFTDGLAIGSVSNSHLPPEFAEQISDRAAEISRIRAGLLQFGISEDVLDNPEDVDISHLSTEEQEQFNDAVREHRDFKEEVARDIRELREARVAAGIHIGSND